MSLDHEVFPMVDQNTYNITRDVLQSIIPDSIIEILEKSDIITSNNGDYRSVVRVSNFYLPNIPDAQSNPSPLYYVHSAFPASSDAVFFGPDTYLFVSWLKTAVSHVSSKPNSIVDVCCGSGAGAIHMARTYLDAQVLGLDLNSHALSLGGVNAHLAGVKVGFQESNLYAAVSRDRPSAKVDVIVSNPPYIASSTEGQDLPIYADGGAKFGLDISFKIVEEGVKLLSTSGVIMLYTGVAISTAEPGRDALLETLQKIKGAELVEYTILHPDMWSEEIGRGAYADVCRIQAVGAVLRKKA